MDNEYFEGEFCRPPTPARFHIDEGFSYSRSDQYEKAIDEYTTAIALTTDMDELTDAYQYRSTAYQMLGEKAKAIADLTWLIEHNKALARNHDSRGCLYLSLGMFEDAAKDLTIAYQQEPYDDTLLQRAIACYRLQRYHDAIADLTTLLNIREQYPTYAAALYHHRGKAYYRLNKFDEALHDFNEIMKIHQSPLLTNPDEYINAVFDGHDL